MTNAEKVEMELLLGILRNVGEPSVVKGGLAAFGTKGGPVENTQLVSRLRHLMVKCSIQNGLDYDRV